MPIAPNVAPMPMPVFVPEDKPPGVVDRVFVELFVERSVDVVGLGVAVATFQPLMMTALMEVADLIAREVVKMPEVEEARKVIVCPEVRGDLHVPTVLPGS